MVLTDGLPARSGAAWPILCPILGGLTPGQADAAMVLPLGDANGLLLDALDRGPPARPDDGLHAAVLFADPFLRPDEMLAALRARGVRGVVNWPSSIFFEGRTREAMAAVPARPELEFQGLARARDLGLEPAAVILSRDQGLLALRAGITRLIVHPGLPHSLEPGAGAALAASLARLMAELRQAAADATLLVYRHPTLGDRLAYDGLGADGVVDYGVAA